MNTPVVSAAGAAGDSLLREIPRRGVAARLRDAVDGVLFWGILGFGILLPFVGAVYAFLRQ